MVLQALFKQTKMLILLPITSLGPELTYRELLPGICPKVMEKLLPFFQLDKCWLLL